MIDSQGLTHNPILPCAPLPLSHAQSGLPTPLIDICPVTLPFNIPSRTQIQFPSRQAPQAYTLTTARKWHNHPPSLTYRSQRLNTGQDHASYRASGTCNHPSRMPSQCRPPLVPSLEYDPTCTGIQQRTRVKHSQLRQVVFARGRESNEI